MSHVALKYTRKLPGYGGSSRRDQCHVDASWSGFFEKLFAKAEEAGRTALKVNPAYTSQDCSRCGHRQKMPLSERAYHCPCCLLICDRDLNAARNIKAVGLHSVGLPLEAPAFTHGE